MKKTKPKTKPAVEPVVETTAPATATEAAKPSRGKKQCPSCNAIIASAAKHCPQCGHQFAPKDKATKKGKPKTTDNFDGLRAAAEFVREAGGLEQAQAALAVVADVGKALGID